MPNDEKNEQTEQTPTGYTVPVPKRNEFFGNLRKAAKPNAPVPKPQQSGMRGKGNRRPPSHGSGRGR
jgi:hypothetical protein